MNVLAFFRRTIRRKTASAVFIDMPNVANREIKKLGKPFRVAWRRLRNRIESDTGGTVRIHAAGYHRPARDPEEAKEWGDQTEPHWKAAGYDLYTVHKKDIDSDIVSDMWNVAKEADDRKFRKLRFIIVSGDGIYAEKFHQIRDAYAGRLDVELYVYSWKKDSDGVGCTSHLLRKAAGSNIRYLESIRFLVSER